MPESNPNEIKRESVTDKEKEPRMMNWTSGNGILRCWGESVDEENGETRPLVRFNILLDKDCKARSKNWYQFRHGKSDFIKDTGYKKNYPVMVVVQILGPHGVDTDMWLRSIGIDPVYESDGDQLLRTVRSEDTMLNLCSMLKFKQSEVSLSLFTDYTGTFFRDESFKPIEEDSALLDSLCKDVSSQDKAYG